MRHLFFASLFILPSISQATVYEIIKGEDNYTAATEYQAILGQLKLHGGFSSKSTELNPPEPPAMTRGQKMVEEAKAKNRAVIAQKRADDKARDEKSSSQSTLDQWKQEVKETHAQWRKEIEDQRLQWKKEQDIFLGRVKVYQAATYVIPVKTEKIVEKKVEAESVPDAHIVNGTFDIPIRDQEARATCAAFAGVRALEIILAQNKINKDLSEQYLYWASKPTCQKSPCVERGSWVTRGYLFSKAQPTTDIPLEASCAYKTKIDSSNETQVPLTDSCHQGVAQVVSYNEVKTLLDVIESVKKNIPVVMSATLTTNFYFNEGLVTLAESKKNAQQGMDQHSLGHAFLAVGVMELPEKLKATEGNYCLVIANSWGKGWGAGGYACLTEKWLNAHRSDNTFIAPTKVAFK